MTGIPNRLGISTGALWPQAGTADAPTVFGRLGLRDVEVMLQDESEYDLAFVRRLRVAFDAVGCSVRSVHIKQVYHRVVTGTPAEVAAGWDLFDRAIDAMVGLGATVLVWHGPNRKEPGMPERLAAFPEAAQRLAERCRPAGITLTIENVAYCALPTVRDVRRFAAQTGSAGSGTSAVGFTFDPFQAADAGASPLLMVAAMGERLANVHLSDYRAGTRDAPTRRHLLPGDGDVPWSALLRAVAGHYAGPLILESPLGPEPDGPFRQAAAFLDPLIRAARRDVVVTGDLPAGVRAGIALFNAGEFYAAHEGLEHEWHAEPGPVRDLYQGILQIGVGVHHARSGNRTGADIKLTAGIARLREFIPAALGIDTAALVADADRYLAWVRARAGDDPEGWAPEPDPPTIRLMERAD